MKAWMYDKYGKPSNLYLSEIDKPLPDSNQILVEINAVGINPIDWKVMDGQFRYMVPVKFPAIPVGDFTGKVAGLGTAVKNFKIGDRVCGFSNHIPGRMAADFGVVKEKSVSIIPEGVADTAMAGLAGSGITAYQALYKHGKVSQGKKVLIIGASGGVGHIAVQLAKAADCQVTAVCSSNNAEFVSSLGADNALFYNLRQDLSDYAPYDLILDCIVSEPLKKMKSLLSVGGTYIALLPGIQIFLSMFTTLFSSRRTVKFISVRMNGDDLHELVELVRKGKLRINIDSEFKFDQMQDALLRSATERARGKIIVKY